MYYHYTNRHGAMAIRASGYLQPSGETGAFGPGVYLTDLDPRGFFRNEILANNYGGINSQFQNRADWVVEVFEKNINMQLLRKVTVPGETDRRIFVYPDFILVQPDQIHDKPTCLRGYVIDDDDTSNDKDSFAEADCYESADEEYFVHGIDDQDHESGDFETVENEEDACVGEEIEGDEHEWTSGEDEIGIEFGTIENGDEDEIDGCGTNEHGEASYYASYGVYETVVDDRYENLIGYYGDVDDYCISENY